MVPSMIATESVERANDEGMLLISACQAFKVSKNSRKFASVGWKTQTGG